MSYSEVFKRRMVQKMTGPDAMSACALSKEEDVSHSSLSRWLRNAANLRGMTKRDKRTASLPKTKKSHRRPQDWPLHEKLRVLAEAESLPSEELGAFLRREGLHEAQLEQWREIAQEAFNTPRLRRTQNTVERKRIKELERELRRKEKALAEAAALLVLKKKAQAIWGDEDDDTDQRNGK